MSGMGTYGKIADMKYVMIATGGTGGHIYPALALADMIRRREPSCRIRFFGSSNRMEAQLIPDRGYEFTGMEMSGMNGNVLAKIKSADSLLKAQRKCRKMLQEDRPDICIGFGNYISVPLIMAAHKLHIPTMIHEQNSFAGKANQMLAKVADGIVGCYDSCLNQFPKSRTRILGNPEASVAAEKQVPADACRAYGIDPNRPFVLFMMGSLGSESVSRIIDQACPMLDPGFEVLIVTGKANEYTFIIGDNERYHIVPYVDGVSMMKLAALSVTRAGATTMAEIAALGAATILIPSPYVPNNHQVYNAMELVRQDAAMMIEEKDLTPVSLSEAVNRLMADSERRADMGARAKAAGRIDAADRMIDWMEDIARHGSDTE